MRTDRAQILVFCYLNAYEQPEILFMFLPVIGDRGEYNIPHPRSDKVRKGARIFSLYT